MIRKHIFSAILLFLLFLSVGSVKAQQNKVDSVILLLNKAFASTKLDSVSLANAIASLNQLDLSDSQVEQLENTLRGYKSWIGKDQIVFVKLAILRSFTFHANFDKGINYGTQQVEKLEKAISRESSLHRRMFLSSLRFPFRNSIRLEDGFKYYTQKLNEYKAKNDSVCIAECYFVLGGFNRISGMIDQAIYNMKKSISYIDSSKNLVLWYNNVGVLGYYFDLKDNPDECIRYNRISADIQIRTGLKGTTQFSRMLLAFLRKNQLDSAAYFLSKAKSDTTNRSAEGKAAILLAEAQFKIQSGAYTEAEHLLLETWELIRKNNVTVNAAAGLMAPDYVFAQLRIKQGRLNEAIDLLKQDIVRLLNNRVEILRDYRLMAELYAKTGNAKQAAETYAIFLAKQDSLLADQEKYRSISFEAEQQMSAKEIAISKLENESRVATLMRNFLIGIAVLLLLLAAGFYQRFRYKKKANTLLETTLANLKATQSQLVQSEKMASLGELTAGIAHEIQNPLNFVNNFSEVSNELIDEMKAELDKGEIEEAKAIATNIQQNLSKIAHHGKRADSIVKGMLQHSRSSTGQKELTDINALCDEYLRLSYHGLRAKDKQFQAKYETVFDPALQAVPVMAQEIGRVVLNLINNAFYAVHERQKQLLAVGKSESYMPKVLITTRLVDEMVSIEVKDNGNGIPAAIREKIFQPFFTTKPVGEGTGLGLSLSYDIITKGHGGKLTVESEEGLGTSFRILLPIR